MRKMSSLPQTLVLEHGRSRLRRNFGWVETPPKYVIQLRKRHIVFFYCAFKRSKVIYTYKPITIHSVYQTEMLRILRDGWTKHSSSPLHLVERLMKFNSAYAHVLEDETLERLQVYIIKKTSCVTEGLYYTYNYKTEQELIKKNIYLKTAVKP